MSPQLVDLDGDGHKDMVMGTYTGQAWIVRGRESGFDKPETILDENKKPILISVYYDKDKEDFINVDRSHKDESHPEDHGTSVAAVDWDQDGDLDLLLGSYEGHLYLRENLGSAMSYRFAGTNRIVKVGKNPLRVPGGMTSPRVVDWDGDGMFDLIAGGVEGGAYFFKNVGTKGTPEFAKAQTLIRPLKSDGLDYGTVLVPNRGGQPLSPGHSWHIEPVDYDNDGDLDLLVGGGSTWYSAPPKKLTKDELAQKKKLNRRLESLSEKMEELMKDVKSESDYEKIAEKEEFRDLDDKLSKLYDKLEKYEGYPDKEAEYIWLYRRK